MKEMMSLNSRINWAMVGFVLVAILKVIWIAVKWILKLAFKIGYRFVCLIVGVVLLGLNIDIAGKIRDKTQKAMYDSMMEPEIYRGIARHVSYWR